MKDAFLIYFLLIIVFHPSCKGQEKSSISKEDIKKQSTDSELKNTPTDYDPYFTESKYITKLYGPQSITRNIIEDRNGNYWLASWEGIIKYDGENFTNYTNKEGSRRYHVFATLEDKLGNLWFGTIGAGVYLYNGKTFTNYTTEHGLAHDRIGCIYEDKKGNIWIGTEGGINKYDGKKFQKFIINGDKNNNDINSIIEDDKGKFWIGSRGKGFMFDGETFTSITHDDDTPFINVRSIIKDKKGKIWLGGNDGLWCYENNTFTNFTKEFVGYIYEDKMGNIWTCSTLDGNMRNWVLSRYDNYSLPLLNITSTQIEPNVGMLFGMIEDKHGDIWFGYLNGIGRYDGKSFEYFREK